MKTYTFKTNTIKNNTINTNYSKSTNYSKILDDIILSSVKENNEYLFTKDPYYVNITTDTTKRNIIDGLINKSFGYVALKDNDEFINATKFLANYKKKAKIYPFILNKVYKLANGSCICFYDDEIQIDSDIYSYSDFANIDFLNALAPEKKKTIIDIYAKGLKIQISL